MKFSAEKIFNLPVETQTGERIGRVKSFNLETESQSVLEYLVKPSTKIKNLTNQHLIISRGQIVEIKNDKIIVDNNFVEKNALEKKEKASEAKVPSGAIMKE